jgi:hypothetical protein
MPRTILIALIGAAAGQLNGCGPVQHRHEPSVEMGQVLPIVVYLDVEPGQHVDGTVYYRLPEDPVFRGESMERIGDELHAGLPTQNLAAGESVAYYIHVLRDEQTHTFGSPAHPLKTLFLNREQYVREALEDQVDYGEAGERIRFVLRTGNVTAQKAEVIYEPPDTAATIQERMSRRFSNQWVLEIDGEDVAAGRWRYGIYVTVDGKLYLVPEFEPGTFLVRLKQ